MIVPQDADYKPLSVSAEQLQVDDDHAPFTLLDEMAPAVDFVTRSATGKIGRCLILLPFDGTATSGPHSFDDCPEPPSSGLYWISMPRVFAEITVSFQQ